jgi:type IV secretion system protein VirD4
VWMGFSTPTGAHTLYVVAPSHEQRRLRPLFQTLIASILSAAYERASENGGRIEPALLVVLDEAANIAPLRDLDTLASTAAGQGIQLVSIFQDLAQVSTRYAERAATVVNNHRAKVLLSGISDPATLEYASRLLGDEEVMQASVTRGEHGERSRTESTAYRSLAPAHVLRGVRPGDGVLVYGHLSPSRLSLRASAFTRRLPRG